MHVLPKSVIKGEQDGGPRKVFPSQQKLFGLLDRSHIEALTEPCDLLAKLERRDGVNARIGIDVITNIVIGNQQEPASRAFSLCWGSHYCAATWPNPGVSAITLS